ncbi:MAG: IS66-like element accessory protein TnpA [Rubrivivax sp.]|jgi:transposase-like protein
MASTIASTMKQADANFGVPISAQEPARAVRRTYSPQIKREVVAQCLAPGASVSAVAMSHRINANVVRKWLPRYREHGGETAVTMLPVKVTSASPAVAPKPRSPESTAQCAPIELILGDATVRLPAGFDPSELCSIVQVLATLR